MNESGGLVGTLVSLPIFEAEWVLWLLIALSLTSVAVMIERWWFFRSHAVDADAVRTELNRLLEAGDYGGATSYLQNFDSLETNVTLFGLRSYDKGPDAVQDLLAGAETRERLRYQRRLSFLATVGSNAPFIGLFGTVLGIIKAFKDLAGNMADASGMVMAGISEALIATAVGLLVAIPAVIAYNLFVGRVKSVSANGELISRTLLSQLKAQNGGA
ncbi:MAG: MotA/TolQ/ExbB proton channel family protein [Myxococcota bacterium]